MERQCQQYRAGGVNTAGKTGSTKPRGRLKGGRGRSPVRRTSVPINKAFIHQWRIRPWPTTERSWSVNTCKNYRRWFDAIVTVIVSSSLA